MPSPVGLDVDVAGMTYTIWCDAPKQGTYHAFRLNTITGDKVWAVIGKRSGRWEWLASSVEQEKPVVVNLPKRDRSGEELKAEGMQTALAPESLDEWKVEFRNAAAYLAGQPETFTSEDVLDLVGLPSGTIKSNANNAVGAMMNGLARTGVIRKTGERRPSKRPSSHGAELAVWVGLRASENRDPSEHPPVPVHDAASADRAEWQRDKHTEWPDPDDDRDLREWTIE